MNEIQKFLRTLSPKELKAFLLVMEQAKKNHRVIPGIKKLKGYKHFYRVRIERNRIVFQIKKGNVEIVKIGRRRKDSYKNL